MQRGRRRKWEKRKKREKRKNHSHTTQFEPFLVLPSHLPADHLWKSLLLLPGSFSVSNCKGISSHVRHQDPRSHLQMPAWLHSITNILFRMRWTSLVFRFWGNKSLGFEWLSPGSWKLGVSSWMCACIFACPQVFLLLRSQRTISFSHGATCSQCKDTF